MSITDKEQSKKYVTIERRYTGHVPTKDFCVNAKEHDYIEVTSWTNHDGYDIYIQGDKRLPKIIRLTNGEFEAIKSIIKQLKDLP